MGHSVSTATPATGVGGRSEDPRGLYLVAWPGGELVAKPTRSYTGRTDLGAAYTRGVSQMRIKKMLAGVAIVGGLIAGAAAVDAAVSFDAATGEGFVGKGDVQTAFGWNNKQLQDNADDVRFRASATIVTEVSWTCTNSNNDNEQVRERTTTTSTSGVVTSVARLRNQVTGFTLGGYDGTVVESSTTNGPQLNSCPSGPWSLTIPAGDPEVVDSGTGAVEVSVDGSTWLPLG